MKISPRLSILLGLLLLMSPSFVFASGFYGPSNNQVLIIILVILGVTALFEFLFWYYNGEASTGNISEPVLKSSTGNISEPALKPSSGERSGVFLLYLVDTITLAYMVSAFVGRIYSIFFGHMDTGVSIAYFWLGFPPLLIVSYIVVRLCFPKNHPDVKNRLIYFFLGMQVFNFVCNLLSVFAYEFNFIGL